MEENDATILFGLKLKNISKDQAELVHGWVSQGGSYVDNKSIPKIDRKRVLKGDNEYTVADAGGNIPAAITVGAYTSRHTHTNKITKQSVTLQTTEENAAIFPAWVLSSMKR